jgi:hypothetical protein
MINVTVEHPDHGNGQILHVCYETGDPVVSVRWTDGSLGDFPVDSLEFIVQKTKTIS